MQDLCTVLSEQTPFLPSNHRAQENIELKKQQLDNLLATSPSTDVKDPVAV
jgi:hypothetical protein